jgi:tetratricopeptide (TPR) repeat protein
MSKKKSNDTAENRVEGVEQALTKAEHFIETYQKQIVWGIGAILAIAVLYIAFQRYYVERQSARAAADMYPAEQYFGDEEWEKALDGDGNFHGFSEIISEYRFSKSANLAKYYAGICCLHLGEYEQAISYLKKFKTKDVILSSIALGGIGDAYSQLDEPDKAVSYYRKAAVSRADDFTSPMYLLRAGTLLEREGKLKEAVKMYEQIKTDYPTSTEGRSIDKNIARIKVKE